MAEQTYASHRRFLPLWHFFAVPILAANVVVTIVRFIDDQRGYNAWNVVVAIAILTAILLSRSMPLRTQDRIIRFEERTRLARVLPRDLQSRVDELTPAQLIALRFAPDDEVAELTRRTLAGELKSGNDIKRAVRSWRGDQLRV